MIRPININLNAAHPELPLVEATTFTGAPSSVFIRGVPKAVGNWSITAVSVAVTYPDNTTTARAAVESAEGVWVATIPGTATSGRTAAGFKIMADGIDENGAAVTGYVLGFADFSVLSFTPVPAPGGTFWLLRYFDAVPATPKKGDVAKIYGVLKFYNGTAWEPFAAPVTLDDAVTRISANGVKSSGIWSALWGALSALPSGFTSLYDWCVNQLAGKASTADATLTPTYSQTPTFSEWAVVTTPDTIGYMVRWEDADTGSWVVIKPNGGKINTGNTDINAISLAPVIDFASGVEITATRTRTDITGYVLGSQSDKPLASEAEAEALRTGKQSKITASGILKGDGAGGVSAATAGTDFQAPLSQTQLANIAAVSDALAFDATHSYAAGDPVVYNGTLYTFTTAHIGAWTGSDVSAVDIIARLAGKANRASPATAGNLASLDASGNPKDSSIPKTDVALKANIPYSLVTQPIVGNGVLLEDRASNSVTISATLSPNTLTINFLPALIGKVRDFAMRLNIAAGVTAPEIAWPQGVTLENDGGEVPEIADGGTGGSSTILYFSETENNGTTAKFLVKGETLTAIAQA